MSKRVETEVLVQEFAEKAVVHVTSEKSAPANRAARRLAEIYRELRSRGEPSLLIWSQLLENEHPAVRMWAASYGLERFPEKAMSTLLELANGPTGVVRAYTHMSLQLWQDGEFKFP
ncbi:MAG: hypothetical protein HC938_14940 [Nitrospira sp.]|nr:hypothetical protein [Nitrospira sp.]